MDQIGMPDQELPPGQQLAATGKWPKVGEPTPSNIPSRWTVTVRGCVTSQRVWTLDDIRSLPQKTRSIDIHCVTRWSKLGMQFSGVALSELLQLAQPTEDARYVSFVAIGERQHSTSLPLNDALSLNSFIATACDGKPLPVEHGGPIRMIVPGRYFYKSLKWLRKIELLPEDRLGFWEETAGYHNAADPWAEQRFVATKLDRDLTAKLIAARDLSSQSLTGVDLQGYALAGLRARRAILRDGRFCRCDLQGACFDEAGLANAHFQEANLRGATFRGADVEGVDFAGADLRDVDLSVSSMLGVSFVQESSDKSRASRPGAKLDTTTIIPTFLLNDLAPPQAEYVRRCLK
jgi:DMSO/TMAO reductase YedYZ molybdopterin-dependent catalytic subunit